MSHLHGTGGPALATRTAVSATAGPAGRYDAAPEGSRPGAALTAAVLAVLSAGLLLLSVVLVLTTAAAGPGVATTARWSTITGVALTCGLAALLLLGAGTLLRRTGRGLLLTGSWLEVGVVLATVAWWTGAGRTPAESLSVATGGGLLLALGLATAQTWSAHHGTVGRWLASAGQAPRLLPAGRTGRRLVAAVLLPVGALGLATALVVAVAGDPARATLAAELRATGVDVPAAGGLLGRPAAPPGPEVPGWSAEFSPGAEACATGSMAACDDLYWESAVGDVYEEYGATCGGRLAGTVEGDCARLLGSRIN